MNEKQLKDIFKERFDFNNWKSVLEFVFGKVEVFARLQSVFDDSDKVKSGKQYGRIKLSDDKSIALFDVEVADNINIERNRQGLRDIAAKYIDQNITHGAIVFYHSKKQSNYRFSFIAKWSDIDLDSGELQKGETQKKRFTYLLGEQQSGATAAKRLLELAHKKPSISIEDVTHAFSVDVLNKEFFKKYKEHYEKFWRYIDENSAYRKLFVDKNIDDQDLQKTIRDFAKKMLGRIVFLHFLQKKAWLGCPVLPTKKQNDEIWEDGENNFMCNLFEEYAPQDKFYSKCLTELFYNTLNQPDRKNNVFSVTGTRVPYLNGGLFDNDQPGTEKMNFPKEYFGDLFDFFAQYNFTIDENSPDEQEVGIDPEMLGHIFENLLEENKEKGAFYTPKEIVQYMCQESLAQYLNNHVPQEAEVDQFIRDQQVSKYLRMRENAVKLNALLDEVKVCDPAIGSGAFPIGILQEIYKAKMHIFPYLKTMNNFDHGETKKKIIENSIYGVDLEHGAVEIARLRFWLALVVDEDKPQPLPNLDYKIMQGNSLLEKFEGVDLSVVGNSKNDLQIYEPAKDLFGNVMQSQLKMTFTRSETVEEIQKLIKKYFNERNPLKKADKKKQIEQKVHEHIDYNLELRENQLARWINEAGDFDRVSRKDKVRLEEMKKELATFEKKRRSLHRIQNTEEKPYFIWHLFFKDVFDRGGFDIVIGNPPYIQVQKMTKEIEALEKAEYQTFSRTSDIYCLFYEVGLRLLKNDGAISFITSNTWMRTKFGELLRNYFQGNTQPIVLINLEDTRIFQQATVETNILIAKKRKIDSPFRAVSLAFDYKLGNSLFEYVNTNSVEMAEMSQQGVVILPKVEFQIKSKIEKAGLPLKKWNVEFYRGMLTGFNEAFYIDAKKREELIEKDPNSEKIIKRLIRGREIRRYAYDFHENYAIYPHNGLKENKKKGIPFLPRVDVPKDFPAIYEHLLQYKDKNSPLAKKNLDGTIQTLVDRTDQGDHWTNIRDCAYLLSLEKEKLVWLAITDKPAFAYDNKQTYVSNPGYFMSGENLKYLLGFLNSKVIEWYMDKISSSTGQGTNQWNKMYIEQLPIPNPKSAAEKEKFETVVDYLMFLHDDSSYQVNRYADNKQIASVFEDVIDAMVYESYFEDHMKELDIDVLKFLGKDILSELTSDNRENAQIVGSVYNWLQKRDNPIRNRIISANIVSIDLIRRINSTTH